MTVKLVGTQEDRNRLALIVCAKCGRDATDMSIRGIYSRNGEDLCTDCIAQDSHRGCRDCGQRSVR